MRPIVDVRDWMELRTYISDSWRFIRARRRPLEVPTCEIRFRNGSTMTLRSAGEDRRIFLHIFGRDEYRLARYRKRAADTVIDVGAHVGVFAVRAARFAKRVLSYEPVPATFRLLVDNVRGLKNVTPIQRAISDGDQPAELHVFPEPSSNSLFPVKPETAIDKFWVETTTLSQVLTEHSLDRCDLIKLDCEGAEYPIIYGAPVSIWQRIDRVVMEYHLVRGAPDSWCGEGLAAHLTAAGHHVELKPKGHHPGKGFLFSVRAGST